MKYLHDQRCTVVAMQDLSRYVDSTKRPEELFGAIKRRMEVTPTQLKCGYITDPQGIDTSQPRAQLDAAISPSRADAIRLPDTGGKQRRKPETEHS
ncbi:MAG TPA: hypothetical protein EYN69_02795 [Flavobacteriales bacterium]|nr:hypothetical protein [Flavobacteriales bacterium]